MGSLRITTFLVVLSVVIGGQVLKAADDKSIGDLDSGRIDAVAAMLAEKSGGLGEPIGNRKVWEELAKKSSFKNVIRRAESHLKSQMPESSDELYLDFSRTGTRTNWERVNNQRLQRFKELVLAECLEDKGRFIKAIEECVRAICSQRSWVMPAHDRSLLNFHGKQIDIDLLSSKLAWNMALTNYLLADRISADTRQLIHDNVQRRVLDPFLAMVSGKRSLNSWFNTTNNWNSVCLAGVTGAALVQLQSPRERAIYIVSAEKYSLNFLKGFTADGYCSEGLGYWNYGYGHYILLTELIYQATGSKVDLLDRSKAQSAATFAKRVEIINGVYPSFADCSVYSKPISEIMHYISRRRELGWSKYDTIDTTGVYSNLFQTLLFSFGNSAAGVSPVKGVKEATEERDFFQEAGILICRGGNNKDVRMGAALKGGHNNEHHNHNDVGSYVVVSGDKVMLVDPGAEVYTARTFSSKRYVSKAINSYGHPVPVVAGKLQRAGGNARGEVVRSEFTDESDTLVLDISSAYNVKQLKKLERSFVYSRKGSGSLTVTDTVEFESPQSFSTALITLGEWKQVALGVLEITNGEEIVRVEITVTGSDYEVVGEDIQEDFRLPKKPTRLGINLKQPVEKATISLNIF
ncbi:MAG: heparinase II/III family protein [Sedimentisphaerales bacterium]|nr:heparinase II/III family protein [Sedimentisphaerales bacterium]